MILTLFLFGCFHGEYVGFWHVLRLVFGLFVVSVVKFYGLRCKVARIENKWLVCIDMGACGMGIYPDRFTF